MGHLERNPTRVFAARRGMSKSGHGPAPRGGACPKVDMGLRLAMGHIERPQYRTISHCPNPRGSRNRFANALPSRLARTGDEEKRAATCTGSTKAMCRILRDFRQAPSQRVEPCRISDKPLARRDPLQCTMMNSTRRLRARPCGVTFGESGRS